MEKDIEELYMKQVQRFMDRDKNQTCMPRMLLSIPCCLAIGRRRLRRIYLQRLKWIHRIKHDALHRKVKKTLQRFIDKHNMDFDEAAESAVEKQKFLSKRVIGRKILPENSDDEEELKEASV